MKELTADTKIRLSQIIDLKPWSQLTALIEDAKRKPGHKPAGTSEGGQFTREYNTNYTSVKTGLKKKYEEIKDQLKPEEKQAIKDYTEDSSDFNDYARNNPMDPKKKAAIKSKVEALDSALEKSEVGENLQAYRTLSIQPEEINKIIPIKGIDLNDIPKSSRNLYINHYLENFKIQSPQNAYISTTINPNYQMTKREEGKPYINYIIKVPHEAKGLYIEDLSKVPHQEELLVLRGYSLDLKKIKYDAKSDRYDIEAEILLEE